MLLYINTKEKNKLIVALRISSDDTVPSTETAPERRKGVLGERASGEKLLLAIDEIIKEAKIKLTDLKKIEVENKGGSFTSLRVGVTVANALGFALGILVEGKDLGSYKVIKLKVTKFGEKEKNHHPRPILGTGGGRIVEPIYDRVTW